MHVTQLDSLIIKLTCLRSDMSIVFTANFQPIPEDGRRSPGLSASRSGFVNVLCPRLFRQCERRRSIAAFTVLCGARHGKCY